MKKLPNLLIALLTASGAMLATNALAYQANSGAGSTTQPSNQRQQQEQARQQQLRQQQSQLQQQLQQARQAEAARRQQLQQQQLQAQRAAARQNQSATQWVQSPTFKALERIDSFGQSYGRVVSRSLIACGTAGAAGSVGGPVGAGVACVGGAVLAN